MTSTGFLSLYYTDCRPGQGLRGGAGFQFQSVSSGVGHDAMTLVQRSALYEAPVAWMREHRAVDSYPPSLTHVFDGMYVTARGVYLGAEANGVREGNQFTHAVTTVDPEDYGLIRPAQLWDAPWWSVQPATSTECDPIAAQPEQGPWGIDAIREWVLGQPDAEDWLVAVSSAFDRAQGPKRRRVLFVGEDAAAILGWIAAGTLLLPQSRALRLGFRVFATNPQYSQHDVLGLHPDWAGSFANPDRDGEFVVFSLDSGKHSVVEHTEAAAYWAPRFLRADPFDVVDAIELAHEFAWQRHHRVDASATVLDARSGSDDQRASVVVVLGEPVADEQQASGLAGWLAGQPPLALEDIVEPVARAVLAASTDASTLGELDGAARLHGLRDGLAGQIRGALLAAEIDEIVSGRRAGVDAEPLPRHNLTPAERLAAAEVVERAAALIPPDRMDLLLRTSTRFDLEPTVPKFRDAAHRFVTWWADHPAAGLDPSRWPCRAMLIDQLRDELAQRPDSVLRGAVREHWWRILLPVADPVSPLDAGVAAAAMERGRPEVQRGVLDAVLGFAQRSDRPETGDLAWDALFRYVAPTPGQLLDLLGRLRRETTSATFANTVWEVLDQRCTSRVSTAELDALALLDDLGWTPRGRRLADMRRQDAALRRWLVAVSARASNRPEGASDLGIVTETVLRARRSDVLRAVLDIVPLAHAPDMINAAGAGLPSFLLPELPALWNNDADEGRRGDLAVAVAFIASGSPSLTDRLAAQFEPRLTEWVRSVPPERLHRVMRLLKVVNPQLAQDWWRVVSDALPKKRRTKPIHPPAASPPNASSKGAAPEDTGSAKDARRQTKMSGRWFDRLRREK
ncbi:MAG: GTPase-associated protein 1-related protein [Actinomycetota bacterium]|nr:GTPase-associated protein 1-related protein [Actinomycetota bacterium]